MKTKGIVLMQFGGPDSLEAVEPFLYNLFSDKDIVQFPGGRYTQKLFARVISKLRYKKLQEKYSEIGGKSPIVEKTFQQRDELQKELDKKLGKDVVLVQIAMRYWQPTTESAIKNLLDRSINDVILLPLCAQYSITNAGSSFNEWDRVVKMLGAVFVERKIISFYNHPLYIKALCSRIESALTKYENLSDIHILFSAHGTPIDIVLQGDPYAKQIRETMELVMKELKKDIPYTLSFQSKVGPKQWLKPDTEGTIRRLANERVKKLLVVPIAFVSDHIETSHELEIEAREVAETAGINEFVVSEGLNDSVLFVAALADLVQKELSRF